MGFEAKSRWGSDRNPGKWRPQKPASSTAASSQGGFPTITSKGGLGDVVDYVDFLETVRPPFWKEDKRCRGRRDSIHPAHTLSFLANRNKKYALPQCRKLLGLNPTLPQIPNRSTHDLMREITGTDISRCPVCKKGTLIIVAELPKPDLWDSS